MWIMLIQKLPTDPSPPKMSMFWSVPWTDSNWRIAERQVEYLERLAAMRDAWERDGGETDKEFVENWLKLPTVPGPGWGMEPNWNLARKIRYLDQDIRVFPHEYSAVAREKMALYVLGDEQSSPSHRLVPGSAAAERALINDVRTGNRRKYYEAALLDGATHEQALCVATGVDITMPDAEFPPIGWYRCVPEYARMFCKPWEMEE